MTFLSATFADCQAGDNLGGMHTAMVAIFDEAPDNASCLQFTDEIVTVSDGANRRHNSYS